MATAGEYRDGRAGAVGDGDLERWHTGTRRDPCAGDLAADTGLRARGDGTDLGDIEVGEAVLQALVVDLLDGDGESFGEVAKAHVADANRQRFVFTDESSPVAKRAGALLHT